MTIKFSKDIYEKISKEAKRLGMMRTQFITMLVNQHLEKKDNK